MSRFHRKIGSWLGLFAILMATLAPTISHTLAALHACAALAGEHCDMPSMSSMSSMDSMPSMQEAASVDEAPPVSDPPDDSGIPRADRGHHTHPGSQTAMPDGDACGYCSLLAHLPVMPSVAARFVITIRALEHTVATRFESVRRAEPLTSAQPRAPPFIA
ncbi:DUF2946 domain-containing protein [Paraburkholderia sp. PREW-6R]|uniref:DUF2946 domain-containing protein n=1 Tax=Paraburkholderia sp. PREW-6R TaxID=3141544 RepID=UPI0031F5CE01